MGRRERGEVNGAGTQVPWRDDGRGLIRYSTEPTPSFATAVMTMLGLIYLVIPVLLLGLFADHQNEISLSLFALAVTLAGVLLTLNIRDVLILRDPSRGHFHPWYTFVEMCVAIPAAVALSLAFGDRLGMLRPLLLLCIFFSATVFRGFAVVATWAMCLTALATVTFVESGSTTDTFWTVVVYAVAWGVSARVADVMQRLFILSRASATAAAELATALGSLTSWETDLSRVWPALAAAVLAERVAVVVPPRDGAGDPQVSMWPASWIDPATIDLVTDLCIGDGVTHHGEIFAIQVKGVRASLTLLAERKTSRLAERIVAPNAVTAANLVLNAIERLALVEELHDLAKTDELTGLGNRRQLFETLKRETSRALRSKECFSIAMIDLDHFKRYNDRFGHPAGDRVLQLVGEMLSTHLRVTDIAARYGGEEFCVLLAQTSARDAAEVLNAVCRPGITDEQGELITFSIGIAQWEGDTEPGPIVQRADLALYESKERGRNRITISATRVPKVPPG